ncbi:MAG: AmmeMemoRadiSam system radical SAM enzyme [Deltaproteobacteria bacterium]|nr:AmmeMemoRadiSam system radical SAM enzyme [Deltaproteobacteria bacterium]
MIRDALLYEKLKENSIHCYLCNHHCKIKESEFGFCGVRKNSEGNLYTHAYGEVAVAKSDPVEKKPLYHFLPGTMTFSIGTPGCNFHCGFCQNWKISQVSFSQTEIRSKTLLPQNVLSMAIREKCKSISYTYTEPTIFFEYALDTSRLAKEMGLYNIFVTNGFMTSEALKMISPYLDACNVDLKSFSENFYSKTCQGHLKPVLRSIEEMKKLGIWLEITTLVIPDQNDSEKELSEIAEFIAGLDKNIPWHISRFHPDYEFMDRISTPLETIDRACAAGKTAGLKYIYKGNILGDVTETQCAKCGITLIRRTGFFVDMNIVEDAACPSCGEPVAGFF